MNQTVAQALLKKYVAWTTDPVLTQADIDLLLMMSRMFDVDGISWDDGTWTPTYDLNWAAMNGWLWKAAKASDRYDFFGDDTRLYRSQVTTHCMAMVSYYQKRMNNKGHSLRSEGNLVVDRYGASGFPFWEEVLGN